MNERIRALANQAHEYALGMYDTRIATEGQSNVLFYQIRDDKFAELIVRECMEVAHPKLTDVGEWAAGMRLVQQRLKQHFGVEQ
jgi:HAMP domain-containing protein